MISLNGIEVKINSFPDGTILLKDTSNRAKNI